MRAGDLKECVGSERTLRGMSKPHRSIATSQNEGGTQEAQVKKAVDKVAMQIAAAGKSEAHGPAKVPLL